MRDERKEETLKIKQRQLSYKTKKVSMRDKRKRH